MDPNKTSYRIYTISVYEVGDPDRYLYGGKEFESLKGINLYDFHARSLTPYGCWPSPDPLAHKFYPISPYSYCGGDPINNIDPAGLETLAFSKDPKIQTYVNNVQDDPTKLIIYSHGNYSGFDYNINNEQSQNAIINGQSFIKAVKTESEEHKNIEDEIGLEIEIKACKTGADNPKGKPNIAEKISNSLPNSFVTAPNGLIKTNYSKDGKGNVDKLNEEVLDPKSKLPLSENKTTTYFRGGKTNPNRIPAIRSGLQVLYRLNNPRYRLPAKKLLLIPIKLPNKR